MVRVLLILTGICHLPVAFCYAGEIIPCGPMGVGSVWRYTIQNSISRSEETRTILSNKAGVVKIKTTTTYNAPGMPPGAVATQELVETLQLDRKVLILKEVSLQGGMRREGKNTPVCGYADPTAVIRGKEVIEVPAGRFNADVVEVSRKGSIKDGAGMSDQWYINYYAKDVGLVKSIIVIEIASPKIAPPRVSNDNPFAAAIAALKSGADPSKLKDMLGQLGEQQAESGVGMTFDIVKNKIVRELVGYEVH